MIKLYAARDKNGRLFLYTKKPVKLKRTENWYVYNNRIQTGYDSLLIPHKLLPNVKWEDEEPTLVTLKIVEE